MAKGDTQMLGSIHSFAHFSHYIDKDLKLSVFSQPKNKRSTRTPLEVFRVQDRHRYRFRFINSASHICPLQIQVFITQHSR